MRWSATVMDAFGRPVEIAFDERASLVTITIEQAPGHMITAYLSPAHFRAMFRSSAEWPLPEGHCKVCVPS